MTTTTITPQAALSKAEVDVAQLPVKLATQLAAQRDLAVQAAEAQTVAAQRAIAAEVRDSFFCTAFGGARAGAHAAAVVWWYRWW